jgi:hypothetical protein
MCTSVNAMLQCDGHHSRVSVPRLEVQTPIRKRDWHYREGKERRHDTRAHGQEREGWRLMVCFTARRSLFLSRPESVVICMTDDDFVRVVGDKRRRKKFVIGEKLIRIIFDQSTILPNFWMFHPKKFFSFVSLSSHWPRPPPTRPGRSSTPIFILRTATGTLWEGPGDLSHCLPVIPGPPAR